LNIDLLIIAFLFDSDVADLIWTLKKKSPSATDGLNIFYGIFT